MIYHCTLEERVCFDMNEERTKHVLFPRTHRTEDIMADVSDFFFITRDHL